MMSFSTSVTSAPSRAAWVAAALPAGPPPMITNRSAMPLIVRGGRDSAAVSLAEGAPRRLSASMTDEPTTRRLAGPGQQGPEGRRPRHPRLGDPRGHRVKPLYTEADLDGVEHLGGLPGLRPVRARPAGHDVRRPAVDDPPVRRVLHRRGVATPSTGATWPPASRACRWPSTSPPTAATTPTTPAWWATSARPAWPSTRSRT